MQPSCLNVAVIVVFCACAALASAQSEELLPPLPFGGEIRVDPVGYPSVASPYDDRAFGVVYDNLTRGFANGSATHLGTCSQMIEDIGFAPGPWASPGPGRLVTELTYCPFIDSSNTSPDEDVFLVFWDIDDINFQGWTGAGSEMINPNATPIAVLRFTDPLGPSFYWMITVNLRGFPGGGVQIPPDDSEVAIQCAWVDDGYVPARFQDLSNGVFQRCSSTTIRGWVFESESGAPLGGNPATIGSTIPSYGRDISNSAMCENIGRFIGNGAAPVGAGNTEHRFVNASPQRGLMIRLKGVVPPGCHGACIADRTSPTGGPPDGGVAIDDLLAYLDSYAQGAICADVDDGTNTGTADNGVTIDDLLYFLTRYAGGC